MQRFPIIITALSKQIKFTPKTLSIRSCTTEIRDNNESENNKQSTDIGDEKCSGVTKLSGFAKSFEKFNQPKIEPEPEKPRTFANLLRHSNLVNIGSPGHKIVTGTIFRVVSNDLYIDFGWKFHCVCSKPIKNGSKYVRGAVVKLMIKELELSSKFMGSTRELTISEARCILLGLISSPIKN